MPAEESDAEEVMALLKASKAATTSFVKTPAEQWGPKETGYWRSR
ncbi:hypothetical protein [Fibrella aquatica]